MAIGRSASQPLAAGYAVVANRILLPPLHGHGLVLWLLAPQVLTGAEAANANLLTISSETRTVINSESFDCHRAVLFPIAVFISLAAAWYPRPPLRSLLTTIAGCAALVWLPFFAFTEVAARRGSIHLGSVATSLLVTANRALWTPPGMAFVVPAALWMGALLVINRRRTPDETQHRKARRI